MNKKNRVAFSILFAKMTDEEKESATNNESINCYFCEDDLKSCLGY